MKNAVKNQMTLNLFLILLLIFGIITTVFYITFSDKLSQGERQKLKNQVIAGISEYLELPIIDWDKTRSRRDYNCYTFKYSPIEGYVVNVKSYAYV